MMEDISDLDLAIQSNGSTSNDSGNLSSETDSLDAILVEQPNDSPDEQQAEVGLIPSPFLLLTFSLIEIHFWSS